MLTRCSRCAHTTEAHATTDTTDTRCRVRGCHCEALRKPVPMPNYDAPGA